MSSRRSGLSLNQKLTLLLAFLAVIGAIIAAFISGHDWFQSSSPALTTTNTPLPLSITPTLFSGRIEFVSADNFSALNSNLRWDPGSSDLSAYNLDGDMLIMTAGPYTWPNFPMLDYKEPVAGDFSAQVKVVFDPEAEVLDTAQMVGLLVRPVNARLVQSDTSFPQDWVVASKYVTDEGVLIGCRGSWVGYTSEAVFLKIERGADSWRCAYSNDGEHWFWFNAKVDDTQLRGKELVISLFAYSITDHSITAEFSDWMIFGNQR